jgi:hypothetical protein
MDADSYAAYTEDALATTTDMPATRLDIAGVADDAVTVLHTDQFDEASGPLLVVRDAADPRAPSRVIDLSAMRVQSGDQSLVGNFENDDGCVADTLVTVSQNGDGDTVHIANVCVGAVWVDYYIEFDTDPTFVDAPRLVVNTDPYDEEAEHLVPLPRSESFDAREHLRWR